MTRALVRCLLTPWLLWSGPAGAQVTDDALAKARRMVVGDPCGTTVGDEVTVCGRNDADRHRLPIPVERVVTPGARDGTSPITAITSHAPCGIFAGERRCAKHEALLYGYGGGRDPLTVGISVVKRLLDPDADLEPSSGPAR